MFRLADNDSVDARMWVAAYEHTPVNILKRLAGDSNIEVRTVVSLQPSFYPEWFEEIKFKLEAEITSFEMLVNYLESQRNYVKVFCILKLLAKNEDVTIRRKAVTHFLVPIKVLEDLAKYPDPDITELPIEKNEERLALGTFE